jgi:hypothetical protein
MHNINIYNITKKSKLLTYVINDISKNLIIDEGNYSIYQLLDILIINTEMQ